MRLPDTDNESAVAQCDCQTPIMNLLLLNAMKGYEEGSDLPTIVTATTIR